MDVGDLLTNPPWAGRRLRSSCVRFAIWTFPPYIHLTNPIPQVYGCYFPLSQTKPPKTSQGRAARLPNWNSSSPTCKPPLRHDPQMQSLRRIRTSSPNSLTIQKHLPKSHPPRGPYRYRCRCFDAEKRP